MKYTKYYGYSQKQYLECKKLINETNRRSMACLSIIGCVVLGIFALLALKMDIIADYLEINAAFSIALAVFVIVQKRLSIKQYNLNIQLYILMSIFLCFAMSISIVNPGEKATIYPVFLALLPVMFVDNAVRMATFIVLQVVGYSIVVFHCKYHLEAWYDIFSVATIGTLTILSHYFFNVKVLRGIVNQRMMEYTILNYKEKQKQLEVMAQRDPFTGLYNRDTFTKYANSELEIANMKNRGFILGILDIDRFKSINDTYGHQIGDEAIRMVSNMLKNELRSNDIVGRLGGDEFIFLLSNIETKETAEIVMNRMMESLGKMEIAEGVFCSASVGLVKVDPGEYSFDQIYYRADMALYKSKELGRNQYNFYE